WLAPSPLSRFLVIQWVGGGTQRCNGLETYDLQTGAFVGRMVPDHPHGDLGTTAEGQEFFLTSSNHPDDPNLTGLAYYLLPGTATQAEPHYVQLLDWKALTSHISCQGPPGVCLISATSWPQATCCRSGWQPFQQEIYLQYLSGGTQPNYGPVVRLAHHRSSEEGYWAQPHATLSQDGHYVLFGSDWGIDAGQEHVDPYLIELSALTVKPSCSRSGHIVRVTAAPAGSSSIIYMRPSALSNVFFFGHTDDAKLLSGALHALTRQTQVIVGGTASPCPASTAGGNIGALGFLIVNP
ncbi:MAG TPA: hypothetical protein VGX03_35550, partial [Candidatus Binatia bacterium]|nr:hypothetical protein [Candidatus Binatia bacterium]